VLLSFLEQIQVQLVVDYLQQEHNQWAAMDWQMHWLSL